MLIERFWRGLSGNIQKKLHFLKNIFVFSEKRVTFASTKKTNTMRTETTNCSTRFMNGKKISNIIDILSEDYSMCEIFGCGIDFEEAVYSLGFVNALEEGLVPDLSRIYPSFAPVYDGEYHHLVYNDECYEVYFKEAE